MQDNKTGHETSVGEMQKKREKMADARRYIIYYTFENTTKAAIDTKPEELKAKTEERENV